MKKKRLAGLALLAPLLFLAGCGGTATLSFSPNWYFDNTTEYLGEKNEKLEYAVTFVQTEGSALAARYENGSYTAELTAGTHASKQVYRYVTEFKISGTFGNDADAYSFEDHMTSEVTFTRAEDGLRPIMSHKEVRATIPYRYPDNSYDTYEFTYDVAYAEDLSSAEYSLDITAPASAKSDAPKTGTVKLDPNATVLDNEELAIALRGLDLGSANSLLPFLTIDPQTQKAVQVRLGSEALTTSASFTLNGEKIEGTIDAVRVTAQYNASQPGPMRKFVYAARKDENSKKYRNVLLSFEYDVMYNIGTMTYTLKNATFNDR